jgi:hypothetical protein
MADNDATPDRASDGDEGAPEPGSTPNPASTTGSASIAGPASKTAPAAQHEQADGDAPGYRFKPSDYMSLAALIISATTAFYNLLGWLEGPTISFRLPELVSFHCYPATESNGSLECGPASSVMIAANNMTYVNKGRSEYSGVLLDETATLRISGRKDATLHWQEFSNVTTLGSGATTATATVIPGSSSIAHETRFFARDEACKDPCDERRNFVPWSEFVTTVSDPGRTVNILFTAKLSTRGEVSVSASCDVFFSKTDRAELRQLGVKKTRLTSQTCVAK